MSQAALLSDPFFKNRTATIDKFLENTRTSQPNTALPDANKLKNHVNRRQ